MIRRQLIVMDGHYCHMVTDFPGLHMRLVFLLDRLPSAVEKALDRLGSRLIRWEVEPPTSDEQLALRKAGMAEGLEFQVEPGFIEDKSNCLAALGAKLVS